MPKDAIKYTVIGDTIELSRLQWQGHKAYISNYPGLLDEVLKHTWTYSGGVHPYLNTSNPNISLHKFVLSFLYGKEQLDQILANGNIIEHLDNDGLNCSFDNLHVISSDYNKAKAFTIDKENSSFDGIPSFVTDVYYSHEKKRYQMQVFLNRNLFFNENSGVPIEELFFLYSDFKNLFMDWLYVLNSRAVGMFDLAKFHSDKVLAKDSPVIVLTEEEKDSVMVQRNGQWLLVIRPNAGEKMTFVNKTAYRKIDT